MLKAVLLDEFHLGFFVPRDLSDPEGEAIRRILTSAYFRRQLRKGCVEVANRFSGLKTVRVTLTR